MDNQTLKILLAQQVVLLKRIEKIELKLSGGSRLADVRVYQEELRKEAMKIIDQIEG